MGQLIFQQADVTTGDRAEMEFGVYEGDWFLGKITIEGMPYTGEFSAVFEPQQRLDVMADYWFTEIAAFLAKQRGQWKAVKSKHYIDPKKRSRIRKGLSPSIERAKPKRRQEANV